MHFCVYKDTGKEILGYLAPDDFAQKSSVRITVDHSQDYIIPCTEYVAGAYEQLIHETGIVGFIINQSNIPNFSETSHVEVSDPDSGFVFYKRFDPAQHIQKRVFRLETQFIPHAELDKSVEKYFQFFASGMERYGYDTVKHMIQVINQPSTYVSGRILYKSFQSVIEPNIKESIISIQDPFYELALRLFIFSCFKKKPFKWFPKRDAILYQPAIDHFHDLKINDEKEVKYRLKFAPKYVLSLLESPLTHQLTASNPSDITQFDSISTALQTLSDFNYVDTGSDQATFRNQFSDLLGVPESDIRFSGQINELVEFSNILRNESIASHILEKDLILYHFIKKADEKSSI